MLHNKSVLCYYLFYECGNRDVTHGHGNTAALSLELRRQPNNSVTSNSQDDLQL